MESLNFFINTTEILWGNYGFQLLFYFSLILVVILEPRRQKRTVWFWYPVCILFAIYNPIMYFVCKYIFGSSQNLIAYYCRLFCLIPIVFIIAYAAVLVLNRASRWKKVGCTFLLMASFILCGHSAYGENWFIKASNVNKVPEDVIQLYNLFQDQDVSIMVPTNLLAYMRQIHSGFHMPYGRFQQENISNQLQSESPDIESILNYALQTNTDYIVTLHNEETLSQFIASGCEVVGYTNKYVVLKQTFPHWCLTQYADNEGRQAMFYTLENSEDGTLLVIDGGWADNANLVRNIILEKGGTVNAWILTHYHPDHIGAFNSIYQDPQGIEIDCVYTSPYNEELFRSIAKEWDGGNTFNTFVDDIANSDNIFFVKRNLEINLSDSKITFLNCWDELLSATAPGDILNNSSLVFKFETQENNILFCGDCHGTIMSNLLIEQYGITLQANYVQSSHFGNSPLSEEFYDVVSPIGVLFNEIEGSITDENFHTNDDLATYFEKKAIQCFDYRSAPNQIFI